MRELIPPPRVTPVLARLQARWELVEAAFEDWSSSILQLF
jgi:hypothetical protein